MINPVISRRKDGWINAPMMLMKIKCPVYLLSSIIRYKARNISGTIRQYGVNELNVNDKYAGINADKSEVSKEMFVLFVSFLDIRKTGKTREHDSRVKNIFAVDSDLKKNENVLNR
jgi:hypothetical protein